MSLPAWMPSQLAYRGIDLAAETAPTEPVPPAGEHTADDDSTATVDTRKP